MAKYRLTENKLRNIIKEAVINELKWQTYANAAKKTKKWRDEHPYEYDRNRGFAFDNAARDAFDKEYGLENQYADRGESGYSRSGSIEFHPNDGEVEISGSRDHDFGDEDSHGLNHNVYHMSKKYGQDGNYGRTRMWDFPHETTPEEFYGNKEKAEKFRKAEKDVEDFKNGKTKYVKGKGWTSES